MAKALVVYDSEIDHTEKMAKAIGERIGGASNLEMTKESLRIFRSNSSAFPLGTQEHMLNSYFLIGPGLAGPVPGLVGPLPGFPGWVLDFITLTSFQS